MFATEPISNPYRLGDHHTLSDYYSENSLLSKTSRDEAKWIYSRTIGNCPCSGRTGAPSKREKEIVDSLSAEISQQYLDLRNGLTVVENQWLQEPTAQWQLLACLVTAMLHTKLSCINRLNN